MNNPPLDFIHIGLGKCASTYLQHVFSKELSYEYVNILNLAETARELARRNVDKVPLVQFPDVASKRKPRIASSECFTFAFLNEPQFKGRMKALHEISPKLLGESKLTSKILIMVRDPVNILRSIHEQYIKQGGWLSYREYYLDFNELLVVTLNLKRIMTEYGKYFEIVVLSSDELKSDPESFWEKYEGSLNVSAPSKEVCDFVANQKVSGNKSLGDRIFTLAMLNKVSALKSVGLETSSEYQKLFAHESPRLTKSIKDSWIWGNRRLVEFASDNDLRGVRKIFNCSEANSFQDLFIDADYQRHIERNFIAPLSEHSTISSSLLDSYQESLKSVVA